MNDASDESEEPARESTDGGVPAEADGEPEHDTPFGIPAWVGALVPLLLLGVVVGGVILFPPFGNVGAGGPLPDVTVTHTTLPTDETVVFHVVNNGPESVTVEQVLIDEAYWSFSMGDGSRTLAPLESARVTVPYHWNPGWDLEAALVLSDGATIHHTIVAPQPSLGVTPDVLWTLALVGLLAGVIPVALGMLWYPFMRQLSDAWLHAVLLFAAGVLAFLAVDAGIESLEVAELVPSAFDGAALVVLGALGAFLLVQAVSSWASEGAEPSPLGLAYMIALGVGLHNLAEGLAIGSAFALGRASLGAFLVIGFMIHNVTEGPAIVAPVARGARPALYHFGAIGLLAGAPIILGGWIGGFAFSPTLGALFLAVGVGAILQVNWEIASMVRRRGRLATTSNLLAFLVGLVVMYATDLLVAI